MAANVNTLKATIERYRKEIDALRGQLKVGQQYLNEQRACVKTVENALQRERTCHLEFFRLAVKVQLDLTTLQQHIAEAGMLRRLRYLFTGSL